MKITGSYTIDAPRERVWAALNDIEVLARIVPGCERLEQTGENEYQGTVKIGIQTIKGTYSGRIRLEDIQPPQHYRLIASGRSANGVVDGSGTVDLVEQDGKTILQYTGDAAIGGTLASVGQRLIEGAAKQMINQSLKALVEQITTRDGASSAGQDQPAAAAQPAGAETSVPEARADAQATQPAPPSASGQTLTQPSVAQAEPAKPEVPEPPQPAPGAQPAAPAEPSYERRTVVVPESEQLKPESMVRGVVEDLFKERPWLPWVVIAFLLGLLFGRSRRD